MRLPGDHLRRRRRARAARAIAAAVAAWSPVIIFTAMPAERHSRDRLARLVARRIDQAEKPEQGEAACDIGEGEVALARRHRLDGERQHALALLATRLGRATARTPASSGLVAGCGRAGARTSRAGAPARP